MIIPAFYICFIVGNHIYRSPQILNLLVAGIIHILHAIWITRNGIRFNNAGATFYTIKMKIMADISLSAKLVSGCKFGQQHDL